MFERWGRFVYTWRKVVLAVSSVFLVLSVLVLVRGGTLTHGTIHGIEAERAAALLDRELKPAEVDGFTVIFESDALRTDSESYREAVLAAVEPLRHHPDVRSVRTPFDPDVPYLLSTSMQSVDQKRAIALVGLQRAAVHDTRRFPALRARIRPGPLKVTVTGTAAFRAGLDEVLQEDLIRAEVLSTPVTLIVLLIVFGSLVAASLPVGVGGLAVAGGIACVMLLSRRVEVAQYAINVASLIGLGVAIDYSLFVVNRFREELAHGLDVPDALARSVATAGRAVTFSGLAVAVGLSGLLFFRGSYVASLGIGGTVVVVLAVVYALTFLPALLGVVGTRVNRLRIPLPAWFESDGAWRRIAAAVMKRPVLILLPTLGFLLALGHPFLSLRMAIPQITVLPTRAEARRGHEILSEHFPERVATRITVLARFPGPPLATAERAKALHDLSRRMAAVAHVDHVESVVDADPMLERDTYAELLAGPREFWGDPIQVAAQETVGPHVAVLSAVTESTPESEEARAIVRAIRRERRVADGEILVTGATAMDLDSTDFILAHAPRAIVYVMSMTVLILFLLLGSVVLPLKAVAMNLLSITGSFGALVWIFQQGHLKDVLKFSPGPVEPSLPIVLFCAVFGLSMDYEVLLLTRMQEEYERTGDNAHAVAEGLEKSARLITSAALIMVVVFSAFVMADIILLKAVGLGMAVAVTLDATIVRLLVVPATMRLFGDLNWWAPAPLARVYKRFSFKH